MDDKLIASSPLAWIVLNSFVNENQVPIEYKDHRFLIQPMNDLSPDMVIKKSAQVGFSVLSILKSIWLCKYMGLNVIYVLPTQNLSKDFVAPKVNPLIMGNPGIVKLITQDRENLKRIGDRNLFFKGAASEREAIAITGDLLVLDEYDRMPDMTIVNTYDSRLQASKYGWRWRFSNPSMVNFGVDTLYTDSDQMHWFIKCTCGHEWYIDFDKQDEELNHYVDQELKQYVCGKCHAELTNKQRRNGRWVAKFPDRKRRGYWISQLIAPWVSAERILEQKEESGIEFFYNFVLGKAYTPQDMVVDRDAILRACSPSNITKMQVAIGVDQDAGGCYFVCMTPQGIFDHGYVDSWEKVEHMKLMYNAVVVCDPNPYQASPKQMANKYSDWYLCYFKTLDGLSAVQWKEKEQVVYADRTRVIDIRANEIVNGRLLYRETPHKLEDVITHWNNLYRTTEEKEDGRVRSIWVKKEDKQSDYPFAEVYARIGLSQLLGGESMFIEPTNEPDAKVTNISTKDGSTMTVDFRDIFEETMSDMQ